jgi:two-component system nitrogen regulation response regulator GlnG
MATFPFKPRSIKPPRNELPGETPPTQRILGRVERPLIELVLERANGNQLKAAAMLGINRNTLRKKITDLKIELKRRSIDG